MIITFVILHYESITDTKECINSLKKYLNDDRVGIVVVDNGSRSGKLINIENEYDKTKIHFLYSKTNLGFACGNNLGFDFAKNKLNSDIIILCNNDLIFKQTDFVNQLRREYKEKNFDIAGPKIYSLVDGKNQNPVQVLYPTINSLKKKIFKLKILYMASYVNLDIMIKRLFSKNIEEMQIVNDTDYQLHGSCLIFGSEYITKFDGLYDGTFMYMEEGILKYMAIKNNLKMLYIPSLEVFHKEGSTTNSIYGKGKKKRQFYYKWNIDGCNKLIKLMSEKLKF